MAEKIFRDPLYNYISIDKKEDEWLLRLLDTPEIQRLRRIHQLGVSHYTFPGAEHTRLAHSLGVLHLMQQALERLKKIGEDQHIKQARAALLSGALIHDVGHGPFSHVFEPCLGDDVKHEAWSCKIILCPESPVHKVLKSVHRNLPQEVVDLISEDCLDVPRWQKNLLSSQLDMDRLDYLRRDSLFSGAGYGHFDWHRIIHSLDLFGDGERDLVWPDKSKLAIEEYIFARFYMYHNVYFHRTTRGFEKILEAMWKRARTTLADGTDPELLQPILDFWKAEKPTPQHYLAIEEHTVLQQIQIWKSSKDKGLSDLARRFLDRDRFVVIDPPDELQAIGEWEDALRKEVEKRVEFQPGELYCLKDTIKGKYHLPYYLPEKEAEVQSSRNAIRLLIDGVPREISSQLERLQNIVKQPPNEPKSASLAAGPADQFRYYVPKACEDSGKKLRAGWKRA